MPTLQKRKHNLRRQTVLPAKPLPANKFGTLAGQFDHSTFAAHDGLKADDNHIYLWLSVAGDGEPSKYECAVNTQSTDESLVMFYEMQEDVAIGDLLKPGFVEELFAYKDVNGLSDRDFIPAMNGRLRSMIAHYAQSCDLVAATGVTYDDGTGLHDIHMNSGELEGAEHPNKKDHDGVIVFYFKTDNHYLARWVFLKFQTQSLSR